MDWRMDGLYPIDRHHTTDIFKWSWLTHPQPGPSFSNLIFSSCKRDGASIFLWWVVESPTSKMGMPQGWDDCPNVLMSRMRIHSFNQQEKHSKGQVWVWLARSNAWRPGCPLKLTNMFLAWLHIAQKLNTTAPKVGQFFWLSNFSCDSVR